MNVRYVSEQEVHTGTLILVNPYFPYVEERESLSLLPLCAEYPGVLLERRTGRSLSRLIDELGGWSLITPVSGWRSLEEQQAIYAQSLRDSGPTFTQQFVALPGHSEHQTGLAIDLGQAGLELDLIRPAFPDTGVCQVFRTRAAAYGFVERYPSGKEAVTGIAHEPWHFRYVGCPHAEIMESRGFTLEEYHNFLKQFPLGGSPLSWRTESVEYAISYVAVPKGEDIRLEWQTGKGCDLSGDNEAGLIMTIWRAAGS